ncbi:hypothetical protein HN807_02705 [Candidatus Bathyarchaeota archaeon]|nr:hypothetical protein [Candidatus Bathyarchaeota archaeon]MBT4321427.1 hypothetical protein [Candidatus Bathyarchaeota archaeon]MBT4424508.1 hypothetical protein [Candidatus Bathyarchaeota archaeon]MBT5642184.1 hypothetical protein [Candidatus Bathyarchaeota archaeon]MBT6603638.1 hypothetical protein [Candidatus Bathyarchaeota archaeon]
MPPASSDADHMITFTSRGNPVACGSPALSRNGNTTGMRNHIQAGPIVLGAPAVKVT